MHARELADRGGEGQQVIAGDGDGDGCSYYANVPY